MNARPFRGWSRALCASAAVLTLMSLATCGFPSQTAPEGATLVISANPPSLALRGDRSTITVLLNRTDGSPVPNDTVVTFTTTLGTIPATANTVNGVVRVQLVSGNTAGTATVRAQSGTADQSASVEVIIGPVIANLTLTADPASLPAAGGRTSLTAFVTNSLLEPIADVPVVFTTTAGDLNTDGQPVLTNSSGRARAKLDTATSATVTASAGNFADTVVVTLADPNLEPTASFVFSPQSPEANERVNFNAASSRDADGTIASWFWDFGDGDTATGERTGHRYDAPGTYRVVLTVTDNEGATGTADQSVTVTGSGPVASFTFSPSSPAAGSTVSFDASTSSDRDGNIDQYSWTWGDGTSATVTGSRTTTHVFANPGTYTVTLTVTDDAGNTAATSQTVTVTGAGIGASFTFSPSAPAAGAVVSFDASSSTGRIVRYSWAWGDGTSPTVTGSATTSHAFSTAGTYTVTLTVTDDTGSTASRSVSVTVS